MSVIIGSLLEAWDELRIHKLRVLLSLIGVAVAVCAMTAVLAIAQMLGRANEEMVERWNGRDVTVSVNLGEVDPSFDRPMESLMTDFVEQFDVEYFNRSSWLWTKINTSAGPMDIDLIVVDPAHATIKNVEVIHGEWFGPGDKQRLAPAIVVNESMLTHLGLPTDLSQQPDIKILAAGKEHRVVTTGVFENEWPDESPRAWILVDSYKSLMTEDELKNEQFYVSLEMWLTPDQVQPATDAAKAFFTPYLAEGAIVDVWNNSQNVNDQENFMDTFQLIVIGIGTVILGIGALSLVNISLVTVQQRIREIGIRRAFGATTGRVFFSIMMESVVATFFAGFIGVLIAVVAVEQFPIVESMLGQELKNPPPFPVQSAVMGLVVSTVIGALAGLIPGIVATKIKPIEAMRAAA